MSVKQCKEVLSKAVYNQLKEEKKLTLKQILFVSEYLSNGLNQTKAYLTVYCKEDESKYNMAGVESHRLLKNPKIREAIRKKFDEWMGTKELKFKNEIIDRQYAKAFYTVDMFFNDDGSCKKLSAIPKEWIGAIEGTEVKYYGKDADRKVVIYKLANQEIALKELSKYIELYRESSVHEFKMADDTAKKLGKIFDKSKKEDKAPEPPIQKKPTLVPEVEVEEPEEVIVEKVVIN